MQFDSQWIEDARQWIGAHFLQLLGLLLLGWIGEKISACYNKLDNIRMLLARAAR
jgi:hypothetical protein